jgi:hypothetical protein
VLSIRRRDMVRGVWVVCWALFFLTAISLKASKDGNSDAGKQSRERYM